MWRWLHSLPRVVRLQCNGSGASAGLHVEELNDKKDVKSPGRQTGHWRSHCKQKDNKHDWKNGSRPDSHDFWRMVHGPHTPIDAVGLGGLVALGVQMGHFTCLHRQHKAPEETRQHCLLSTIALHTVSPSSDNSSTKKKREKKYDSTYKHSSSSKVLETVPEHEDNDSEHKKQAIKEAPECESLEEAFRNFEKVCQKYTATGKGIMGSQEAQKGNMKSAAALWGEASKLGNAKSHFNLGVCYETGRGVKKDLKEAVRLYKMAAEDLHPQAMYNLGLMYLEGSMHTPRDTHQGLQLISTAADFGLPEAQCYLGVYYTGENTENEKKAVHYLTLAANQQNSEAQYCLGLCYQHGYGVNENMCKASDLFSKAAENGHPDALYSMAVFHQEGLAGLPQDEHCAKRLLEKAAAAGCQDAISEIQKSEKTRNDLSAVIEQIKEKKSKKHESRQQLKNVTYQFRLNSSVSSPCLTELLRQDMVQINRDNKDLYCDPVSDTGTLSKLYTQLMVPRGFTMTPTVTKVQESRAQSHTETDSDSGIVFRVGIDTVDEEGCGHGSGDGSVPGLTCSSLHRTSTMPDLTAVACL